MNIIKSGLFAVALVAISQSVMAAPFAYEARSLGMGTIGVATADIATAPFMNPAMLSFQKSEDDFSLLLTAGAFFSDNDGMVDNIDRYQVTLADLQAEIAKTTPDPVVVSALANELLTITTQLNGKVIAPEVTAGAVIGVSGEVYSMAVSARSDVVVVAGLTDIALSQADLLDPTKNILNIAGVKTNEVGLSVARSFEIMDSKISIGITPKIINVEALEFSESIMAANTGLNSLVDHAVQDLGEFTTADLGIVIGLTNNIRLGVTAKNLITDEVSFQTTGSTPRTILLSFDTQIKAGLAYSNDFITIGADFDITESDPVLVDAVFGGMKKKNMSVGMEIDIFNVALLRVGMVKNTADGISAAAEKPLYTAGVGLWLGFNLDVAVIAGEGDSAGGFVQAGFKF